MAQLVYFVHLVSVGRWVVDAIFVRINVGKVINTRVLAIKCFFTSDHTQFNTSDYKAFFDFHISIN